MESDRRSASRTKRRTPIQAFFIQIYFFKSLWITLSFYEKKNKRLWIIIAVFDLFLHIFSLFFIHKKSYPPYFFTFYRLEKCFYDEVIHNKNAVFASCPQIFAVFRALEGVLPIALSTFFKKYRWTSCILSTFHVFMVDNPIFVYTACFYILSCLTNIVRILPKSVKTTLYVYSTSNTLRRISLRAVRRC